MGSSASSFRREFCSLKFGTKMSGLEAIDRNSFISTIDVDSKMFISSFNHRKWTIVRWLEWFANSIMSDKDMCGSG